MVHRRSYSSRFNLQLPPGAFYGRREKLIKQTYSVFIDLGERRRKWHMSESAGLRLPMAVAEPSLWIVVAYFTQETANTLYTVQDFPHLASLQVPPGSFRSARSAKGRPRAVEYTTHTVDSSRHNSPKRGSLVSAPYTYAHRQSPILKRPVSASSSFSSSRQPAAAADQNLPDIDFVAPTLPQPYEQPYTEPDLGWLQCVPPAGTVSCVDAAEVGLAPLAFLENSHIPKRHPVDDRALRAFSLSP